MINIRLIGIGAVLLLVAAIYLPGMLLEREPMPGQPPPPADDRPGADLPVITAAGGETAQALNTGRTDPDPPSIATENAGEPGQTLSIRGSLVNEFGQGLAGFGVDIRPTLRLAGIKPVYSVTSNADGEFRFDGIPPDMTYRLDVEASQFYEGYTLDPVPLNPAAPVTTIILKSIDLMDVDGMIVDADDAPIADFEIFVQNLTVDFPGRWIKSDASGYFRLDSFPAGKLQLYTAPPDIFKIEDLQLRRHEYRNLKLKIDKGGYHLYGWVSDENQAPLEQARVTLNSTFDADEYHSLSYRSTKTDRSGGFSFTNLGRQDHRLAVEAAGYASVELIHRFQSFSDTLRIQMHR